MQPFPDFERVEPPRDILIPYVEAMGDPWAEHHVKEYWADYCGIARHFKPERILEIGVRFGYSAFCLLFNSPEFKTYLGLDNQSYIPNTNERAVMFLNHNFPNKDISVLGWNTNDCSSLGTMEFDLVHIDGDHETLGALNDLVLFWPNLRSGGVLVLDDIKMAPVEEAANRFIRLMGDQIAAVGDRENIQGHRYFLKA